MKTHLLALLTVAALAMPAVAAKPSFDMHTAPAVDESPAPADRISRELAALSDRVDRIERSVDAMRATTHSMLSELMAEPNRQVASPQPASAAATAPAVTCAAPVSYVQDTGPVLQAWVEPAPGNWNQYRNAQGQLPSTSVGGQTITASPTYTYIDRHSRTVVDYPVAVSTTPPPGWQPVQSVPLHGSRSYGASCYGGACYGGSCYGGRCVGGGCASCR